MTSPTYIKTLKNADLLFQITSLFPLVIWIWFGFALLKHIVPSKSKIGARISKTIAFPLFYLHIIVFLLYLYGSQSSLLARPRGVDITSPNPPS